MATETKAIHTQGPWIGQNVDPQQWIGGHLMVQVAEGSDDSVAILPANGGISPAERDANARLLAAAQSLAESLREALTWLIVATSRLDNPKAARSAIIHLRKYIAVLEMAGIDPQIRMQGVDEIEAAIAKAEGGA
jgi:hypothetical protein